MLEIFKPVWRYRQFIIESVKRDFKNKANNSLLGFFGIFINPLAMIFIYTIIFSKIMRGEMPEVEGEYAYSIYLCSGILVWSLFSEVINRSQNCFIENANLIKKVKYLYFNTSIVYKILFIK